MIWNREIEIYNPVTHHASKKNMAHQLFLTKERTIFSSREEPIYKKYIFKKYLAYSPYIYNIHIIYIILYIYIYIQL